MQPAGQAARKKRNRQPGQQQNRREFRDRAARRHVPSFSPRSRRADGKTAARSVRSRQAEQRCKSKTHLLADLQRVPAAERRQHADLIELGDEGVDLNVRVAGDIDVRLHTGRSGDGALALRRLLRGNAASEEALRLGGRLLRRRRLLRGRLLRRTRTAREGRSGSSDERKQHNHTVHRHFSARHTIFAANRHAVSLLSEQQSGVRAAV